MSQQPLGRQVDIDDHGTTHRSSTTLDPDSALALLSADERCDRCGARAKALAILATGGRLFFCGHHTRTHRNPLLLSGARLYATPL